MKKKAALVLSGGAALGAIELGIISVLEEDYDFDFFAGTSIGSLISVFLATGKSATEILEIFTTKKVGEILLDFSLGGFGFISGESFLEFLESEFGETAFDDLDQKVTIVATNFTNGERVDIDSGLITEAVRSSCGIPLIFSPYFHSTQKKWLVDGGLSQNFPLDIAQKKYDGDIIIGINVGTFLDESIDFSKNSKLSNIKNAKPTVERIVTIMMRNQSVDISDDRMKIFEPNIKNHSSLSFSQKEFKAMFESGRKFAKEEATRI